MIKVKVSEVAKINAKSLNKNDNLIKIKYLDTGNITEGKIDEIKEYNTEIDKIPSRAKRRVKKNTIVYSTVRPRLKHYGILKETDENLIVSTGFVTIDANPEKVNPLYLYYQLTKENVTNYLGDIADTAVSSYPSITPDDIGNIEIDLIPIEEQNKIGEYLNLFDEKINNNNNIYNSMESMLKTLYEYWFYQYEFPNNDGNPYKSSGGKLVWNEQLKKNIPEGWQVKKVSELLNVVTGKKDANFATKNGKYNFFTCANDISKCDEYEFEGKSVLIAGNGDFNVKYYNGKFNAYQRTYVLIPEEEKYIGLIYQSAIRKIATFKRGSNGSIVKFITKGDIDNLDIIVPNDLRLIDSINNNMDMLQNIKDENERLESTRNFLLSILINKKQLD